MNAEKQHDAFITKIFAEAEYYDIVRNTLYRNIPDAIKADIDDCISDVYAIAVAKKDLEQHPCVHGWLSKVAKNVARNFVRKRYNEAMSFADIPENALADLLTPAKILEDKTLQGDFIDLLKKQLTPEEYLIYELKYVKRFSNAEIASIIGIKASAVNMRISRLKNKMTIILYEM